MDIVSIASTVLHLAGIPHGRVSVIGMSRSQPGQLLAASLVFVDDKTEPTLFVKLTTDMNSADALRAEFDNLSRLAGGLAEPLRSTVPAPVWFGELEGVTVLAETALSGRRMKNFPPDRYFCSSRFRRHLGNVVEWLHGFHLSMGDGGAAGDPARRLRDELDVFRRDFRSSSRLDELLRETEDHLTRRAVPLGPWHGDFCTANVLVPDDRRVHVIDWEQPSRDCWPLADLLYFISSLWCIPHAKGPQAQAANYRRMFFGEHHLSAQIVDAVRGLAAPLDVAPVDVLPLSVITWVVYANLKRRLLTQPGDTGAEPADHWPLILLDGEACLNLELLAEHRDDYRLARL